MEMVRNSVNSEIQFDVCQTNPALEVGDYEEEFTQLGGLIHRCPLRKNLFAFNRDLRRILRKGGYDIFHCHHYLASGYFLRVASEIEGLRLVAHMHPTMDFATGKRRVFSRPLYQWLMKRWIYRYADAILGASEASLDLNWGINWRNDNKIHFQPNGIDLSGFKLDVNPSDIRQKLHLPSDSKIVLTVGRHVPHKKHDIIPDIAKEICRVRPDVYFVINGEGPLKNELENKIRKAGLEKRFCLTAGMPSLIPLWKASDVFLFPSIQEGFGIVVIEAAVAGLPVVARKIPGVIEASTVCDNVTLLEQDSNIEQWVKALENALNIGRKKIEDYDAFEKEFKFTTKKSLDKLLSVYKNILE
jgi:glycosyltransferase EpsF